MKAHAARDQLIARATPIFAAKGYAAASTREICEAAGVNAAAIHYHFGDKEGLYREVLLRPVGKATRAFGNFDDPALSFEQTMRQVLAPFVKDGDLDGQLMKLHLREMLEPSAAFRRITEKTILPVHAGLTSLIARHCGVKKPDADIHELALAMVAMAVLTPVLQRPKPAEHLLERLVGYCRALLDHELARRKKKNGTRR